MYISLITFCLILILLIILLILPPIFVIFFFIRRISWGTYFKSQFMTCGCFIDVLIYPWSNVVDYFLNLFIHIHWWLDQWQYCRCLLHHWDSYGGIVLWLWYCHFCFVSYELLYSYSFNTCLTILTTFWWPMRILFSVLFM